MESSKFFFFRGSFQDGYHSKPDAQCMVYLPTFTRNAVPILPEMYVNRPYIEHLGKGIIPTWRFCLLDQDTRVRLTCRKQVQLVVASSLLGKVR